MSEVESRGKHLPKIFSEKVARDRVRFWYWLIQSAHEKEGGIFPRQLENKFRRDGPLSPGDRGSRIWDKYRDGKATPMVGPSQIVDLVDEHPDYKHLETKKWLEIDLWRLMDEEHLMTPEELWKTFKGVPDYWPYLVDGSSFSSRRKKWWRFTDQTNKDRLIAELQHDLDTKRTLAQLEQPLRAVYALIQESLLTQNKGDYDFWRTEAEKVEQDPNVDWIGILPRSRERS